MSDDDLSGLRAAQIQAAQWAAAYERAVDIRERLKAARARLDANRASFIGARLFTDCGDPSGSPIVHPLSGIARLARDWRPMPSATIIRFPVERTRRPAC
jgi:hypothetical protein